MSAEVPQMDPQTWAEAPPLSPPPRRRPLRFLVRLLGLGLLVFASVCLVQGWQGFGARATGVVRDRLEGSPQWHDGSCENPQPLENSAWGMLKGAVEVSPNVEPKEPPPTVRLTAANFVQPPASGLRVTWLGHSTTLVEIEGVRLLTDPVWSERATPVPWLGPRRWFEPPLPLAELPAIDAVLVSHDHYDHLDAPTIMALRDRDARTRFIVPLGVGAHLAYWGIEPARIVELDWWESAAVGDLTITCTPSRHASGRMLFDYDAKLWGGYALLGKNQRVYYSGDTGLFPAMRDIGARLGPFDLTMIEVGQYGSAWPDWHLGPEQAVIAHQMVRGRVMLPVHWGTFALAYHAWTEPIERALVAADLAQVPIVVPKPGQSFEPASSPRRERWWPEVPWKTAAEDPIVSTKMDSPPTDNVAQ